MPRFVGGLILIGALVLAGCGLGEKKVQDPAEQPAISKAQLAAMMLPAEELGAAIAGLEESDDDGIVDNVEAADDSLDPDDSAKSLRSDGRLTGYEAGYEHPKLLSAKAKKGMLGLGTGVDLLEDPVYAAQYLHARLTDYERFRGKVPGLRIAQYAAFEAVGIGDEAGGQRAKLTIPGVLTGYETDVFFRRGRIVASVEVVRADPQDAQEEALELAAALDRQIRAVLAGEIEPVKPRRREEDSTEAVAAERKKLPKQTLTADDIGQGVVAVDEGEIVDDAYVGYQRTFEDVVVGGSHLMRLQARTLVYDKPEEAALAYRLAGQKGGREIFVDAMIKGFARESGVTPTDIRVRRLPSAGRGMTGLVVTFKLVGARFELVSIFTRAGRRLQSVTGICRPQASDPDNLRPLAQRARARLAA